jgi:hypothetical protein
MSDEYKPNKKITAIGISKVKQKLSEDAKAITAELKEDAKAITAELQKLLAEAEAGKIIGFLYIVSKIDGEGTEFVDGSAGVYNRYPTDAVGQIEVVKLKHVRRALDG